MNIYAATTILFLSSAQAQQIQSPTAALTTFVPTEGSNTNDELVVIEELRPMSIPDVMSLQTAQIIEAFGYDSKSSKTGGHGYGGYGYGGYDSKSAKKGSGYGSAAKGGKTDGSGDGGYRAASIESTKGGNGSAKSDKGGYGAYDAKSAKKGSGYGGYRGGGYGAAIEAPLQQSTFEIEETSATPAVEVEETSESDVPDVDEIVGYLSSLLAELLDVEGQADAVKPATVDMDSIYGIIKHFLNGYGSKSSKSKSGKRF